jgi:hypothetical protein
MKCLVADIIDDRGQWQWETFAHFLRIQMIMILAGDNRPTSQMKGDKAYSRHSIGGHFSLKSAYLIQEESRATQQQHGPLWNII